MANKVRESLEKRARQAIWQNALLRWESATVIALTFLLAAVTPQLAPESLFSFLSAIPSWAYLAGGALAEAALVFTSITDPKRAEKVVADMLRDEFRPEKIRDKALQAQVNQALDYHRRIAAAAREREDSVLKDSLNETVRQIDEWMEDVYDLAQRLDRYRKDQPLMRQNLAAARTRLAELTARLAQASGPRVREDIATNIASLQRKIETIESVENAMERALLRLEHTVIAIGTIYSQTMLVGAKGIDSSRKLRLRHEIADEVNELGDILAAMDEVYGASQSVSIAELS